MPCATIELHKQQYACFTGISEEKIKTLIVISNVTVYNVQNDLCTTDCRSQDGFIEDRKSSERKKKKEKCTFSTSTLVGNRENSGHPV